MLLVFVSHELSFLHFTTVHISPNVYLFILINLICLQYRVLNITEFSLPQSPDPITKCRAQGSWLHVITQSGHLTSVHFSLQLRQCNDNNNSESTKWNLLCQPTNFPRLPIHLSPVNNIEQWIKSCPRWRNLNVCDFTRLAGWSINFYLVFDFLFQVV